MKKFFAVTLLLFVLVSGAFALDMNIGAGALFSTNNYNGNDWDGYYQNGFGAFAFFGVSRFFDINLGFINKKDDWDDTTGAIQFGLYFKYPFATLNDRFVFFPSLGIDFEYALYSWAQEDEGWDMWHELYFRGGLGLDLFITEKFFLRGHILYGVALPLGTEDRDYYPELAHGLLAKLGIGWMF